MAKYQIASINYITSGSKRTLLNIDTQIIYHNIKNVYLLEQEQYYRTLSAKLSAIGTEEYNYEYYQTEYIDKEHPLDNRPNINVQKDNSLSVEPLSREEETTSIILNEKQKYGYDTSEGNHMNILLQLSSDQLDIEEAIERFSSKRHYKNRTFEIEQHDQIDNSSKNQLVTSIDSKIVYPIYDIRDVSIKTYNEKVLMNSNLNHLDQYVDIYAPDLNEYPIGFCQCENDSYLLTEKINKNPYFINTSLITDRLKDIDTDYYSTYLSSNNINTYLYNSLKDIGLSSYSEYCNQVCSEYDTSVLFKPVRNLNNIDYNYVLAIDQQNRNGDYNKGDIYAQQITTAKNSYNSLYSMQVSDDFSIHDCREYCGITNTGGNIYLKFYDNNDYNVLSSRKENGITNIALSSNVQEKKYPYQKIEMFLPNNFNSKCRHKSNLFSVRIKNKNIERLLFDETQERDIKKQLYGVIKKEIKNGIKEIVKNVCPAHTQFFDVYFEN